MDVLTCIETRRSIRGFEKKEITKEQLTILAEAARSAPTAMNLQTRRITVVQNKEMLEKLMAVIGEELGREGYNFYFPDVLIIASDSKTARMPIENCACALQNVFLAAHSMGLGSVWINQLNGICDRPAVRAVLKELNLPDDHDVWGMAAVGYPAAPPRDIQKTGALEWVL
ncbi:MAG: nitroreductase family protein [Oscillospiraceae bacterium]|nr:nitroreductase family protein [Oscillospiraceae bacterium]